MADYDKLLRARRRWMLFRSLHVLLYGTCVSLALAGTTQGQFSRNGLEGRKLSNASKLSAVNLGGWLVIEKWIRPSLWDSIPDADLLDGAQIQLRSVTLQTYVSAEDGGGEQVVVNRINASGWETFKIWRYTDGVYSLRVFNNEFIGALNAGGGNVTASAEIPGEWERFTFTRNHSTNMVHIRAYNGMYLQAKDPNQLTADYDSGSEPGWDDNSATFQMIVQTASPFHGEYQLANGLGPDRAAIVFKEHRDSFVTEADFQYLNSIGINGVRIPVGWWVAYDPPPKPFVAGSLQALDNAFQWAEDNQMQVIIDLHAAPGSQNGQEHSATIDGVSEWASGNDTNGESYINETLNVIDFLSSRYGKRPGLYGIELLNEPMINTVPIDVLKSYYRQGYQIVRKYSSSAYVVMCELLGGDPHDLVDLGTEFQDSVIDLHYYNVFGSTFANMTPQQNIDYINNQRKTEIESLTQNGNGLLTFVGEWTNEWATVGANQSEYQKFGQAQLNAYGETTAGWAYWNYIIDDPSTLHWDFKRSYQDDYLLKPSKGWIP